MKKGVLHIIFCLAMTATVCFGQNHPFPQNRVYSYGLMPGNRSHTDAQSAYNTWKNNFVVACSNGRFRVRFDNQSETVSEGIAYGMLLASYMADRTLFDGLWNYYKDFRNGRGVMHWKTGNCSGVLGQNGATDAELDAALALIVAHNQWGSGGSINYSNDAKALIAAIKAHEVEAGSHVLKPGDAFGGSNITNPSYYAPGYYRVFGQFTNDVTFWNNVASRAYIVINNNLSRNNAAGGLVSDWCKADGTYSSDAGGYYAGGTRYHYDAARTPWRIATDFVWYGTADAKNYIKKASDFVRVNLGGSQNVRDGYHQNGSAYGQWHNSTFTGAFACAAMGGDNQNHLNNSYGDLRNINDASSYYNQTLKTIYLFMLTGNFYLPGGSSTSPPPTNNPPTVNITSPENNASFTAGSNITITASAADSDGSVTKVEFFQGSVKLGERTTSPWSFTWNNVAAGSYTLTARATDNGGATTTSAAVSITVVNAVTRSPYGRTTPWPIPGKIEAENFDNGGQNLAYYDNTSGNAGGAYRNEHVDIEATTDAGGGHNVGWTAAGEWLTYSVNVASAGNYDFNLRLAAISTGKSLRVEMDGVNVTGTVNVPNTGGWQNWQTVTVPNIALTAGNKIMRIFMITDGFNINFVDITSSQTTPPPPPPNNPPSVSITSPANNATFTTGANISISANATDSDGSVTKVEFFQGSVKIGERTSSPWSITWNNVAAGSYTLTARATDNGGASTTSAPVNITVNTATNNPPTVSITSPTNNATFTAGSNIAISASASDSDGSVTKVEFFSGTTKLGERTSSPWSITWNNVAAGSYALTARATDNGGATTTSSPVNITVTSSAGGTCVERAIPAAIDWIVRNDWTDQNNGSGVSNESSALKVTHRQWGRDHLWIIEMGKSINIVNGKQYTVSFDFRDDPNVRIASVNFGFATGAQWDGPVLAQPAVTFPAGYSATSFTTKSVNITATSTRTVHLAFRLNWNGQPNMQVNDFIKNISVCEAAARMSFADDVQEEPVQVYPQPFTSSALVNVTDDSNEQVHFIITDLAGKILFETTGHTNQEISLGENLTSGIYILQASYAGRVRITRLVKR